MQKELDPKAFVAAIAIVVVLLAVLGYFLFKPAPTFDITKIKGRPPPGWKIPDVPATAAVPVVTGANAGRPAMGGPPNRGPASPSDQGGAGGPQ